MDYPGTSPMGARPNPYDLEQRKQGVMSRLSFGGSGGDAPGAQPGLSFNPFFAALQQILGNNNFGQQGNADVNGSRFFGPGGPQGGQQNVGGNNGQAGQAFTGVGGVTGSNPGQPFSTTDPTAGRLLFGVGPLPGQGALSGVNTGQNAMLGGQPLLPSLLSSLALGTVNSNPYASQGQLRYQ